MITASEALNDVLNLLSAEINKSSRRMDRAAVYQEAFQLVARYTIALERLMERDRARSLLAGETGRENR